MSNPSFSLGEYSRLLSGLTPLRSLPAPPTFLIDLVVQDDAPDEVYERARRALIAPFWNEAVRVLYASEAGYQMLLKLRERLLMHSAEEWRLYSGQQGDKIINSVLQKGHDLYGPDQSLRASLGTNLSPRPTGTYWLYVSDADPYDIDNEAGGKYVLVFPGCDDPACEDTYMLREFRTFDADRTWGECCAVDPMVPRIPRPLYPSRVGLLVDFRLDVVDQVLKEYEVLGFVGSLDVEARDGRAIRFSREEAAFIREVVLLLDKPGAQYRSRRDVIGTATTNLQMVDKRGERMAERLGAYRKRKGGKKGRLPVEIEANELIFFAAKMRALHELVVRYNF